jgi:hypothetical protein
MGGLKVRNAGRRYRRRLRRSSLGLVSVVGTLLALLVFFTLFGIFLTQYLPLWMTDNEAQFTAQTQTAMANLKSNVDLQMALNGPNQLATPFVMASQGVPLLAAATPGVLNFIPTQPGVYANVTMNVGPGGGPRFSQNFSLGELQMYQPNRYYSPQTFVMEDDAIVEAQTDTAQVLAFPLAFAVNTSANYSAVTMSLVQLYGNATQTISSGSQEVYTHFLSVQSFVSHGFNGQQFNASFQIGTHYPCAWSNFLVKTMAKSTLGSTHWTVTPNTCTASGGSAKIVTLKLTKISSYTLLLGQFAVVVGVGLG